MDIRTLTPGDAEVFQSFMLSALRELPTGFAISYEELAAESMDSVRERLRPTEVPATRVFGAFDEAGTMAGVVSVRQQAAPLRMRHKGTVGRMYVAPAYRRLGLARRLLEAVLGYARNVDGLEQLNLIVDSRNAAAQRLYEAFGFVPFGLEPRELKVGDGYSDSVHMWMKLGE